MFLNRFSVKNQILFPFVITAMVFILALLFAKVNIDNTISKNKETTESVIYFNEQNSSIIDQVYKLRISAIYAIYDSSRHNDFFKTVDSFKFERNIIVENLRKHDGFFEATEELIKKTEIYIAFVKRNLFIQDEFNNGNISKDDLNKFSNEFLVVGREMVKSGNTLSELVERDTEKVILANDKFSDSTFSYIQITIIAVWLISFIGVWLLSGIIVSPIITLQSVMRQLASGDLSVRASVNGKSEISQLSHDINQTAEQFTTTVSQLVGIGEQVAAASTELASVMNQSEINSQQEIAEIEQIASAVNQLASSANEVSGSATMANKIASEACSYAEQGLTISRESAESGEKMTSSLKEAAKVVRNLKDQSQQVNNVIEVIRAVSEQTNLLALNAAIEAARAGESGRGFAVVADEVRLLASRTQDSTVQIQNIIEELQTQSSLANEEMENALSLLEHSNDLTLSVNNALINITKSVERMSDANAQVADASQEQAQVTESINYNVTTMTELISQNVAGTTQCASASNELSLLAEKQKENLTFFKVSN